MSKLRRSYLDEASRQKSDMVIPQEVRISWMAKELLIIERELRDAKDAFQKLKVGQRGMSLKSVDAEVFNLETSMQVIRDKANRIANKAKNIFKAV